MKNISHCRFRSRLRIACLPLLLGVGQIFAGNPQRIGHTTLTPRHSGPDDKGMYAAVIDPTNGYAYFFGNYLFKLDLTGSLPVLVGTNIFTGQFTDGAIDPAAGYAYMPKASTSQGTIYRFALGTGTNSVSAAGTTYLSEVAWPAISMVVDNSDPNPANHYGYVMCSGNGSPAKVVKLQLSTMTEVSSVTLNTGETNFAWGQIDTKNGYAYFGTYATSVAPGIPRVVKIKLTSGNNSPIRLGTVALGATPLPMWTSSIDTVHGYAYYATDNGTTNLPETIFKVALGTGDALPTPVPFGGVTLHTNEVQLISQFNDPVNGFVYFGNDNVYPGRIYQFAMNGTNPPIEVGYLSLQGGTQPGLGNGVSGSNTTTNSDGILPYGEVYLRSCVYDSVRGYAYFGQDSRPNQVVKFQPAVLDPVILKSPQRTGSGFQFSFSNAYGATFTAYAATNLTLATTNWTAIGSITDNPPGQFQYTDPQALTGGTRFYRVTGP